MSSKRSSKLSYVFALLVVLGAPLYVTSPLYPRELIYVSASMSLKGAGDAAWLHRLIFEQRGPIDLVVIGASQAWTAIVPADIEANLKRPDGRPLVVRTMAHNWCQADIDFTLLQDLIEHRKVQNLLIASSTCPSLRVMHEASFEIWPRERASDLPSDRISPLQYYAVKMFESPRKLLSLLRAEGPLSGLERVTENFPETNAIHGNLEFLIQTSPAPFTDFPVRLPYTSITSLSPKYDQEDDDYDYRKIHKLAEQNGIHVIWMNVLNQGRDDEAHFPKVALTWPGDSIVGFNAKHLFERYSDADLDHLFYNPVHFNRNGARFFTRAVLPQLGKAMNFP